MPRICAIRTGSTKADSLLVIDEKQRCNIVLRRESLFHLLKNPVYRSKIVHKRHIYDGEHEAIVDEEL